MDKQSGVRGVATYLEPWQPGSEPARRRSGRLSLAVTWSVTDCSEVGQVGQVGLEGSYTVKSDQRKRPEREPLDHTSMGIVYLVSWIVANSIRPPYRWNLLGLHFGRNQATVSLRSDWWSQVNNAPYGRSRPFRTSWETNMPTSFAGFEVLRAHDNSRW